MDTSPGHIGPLDPSTYPDILAMNWLVPGWFEVEDVVMWAGDPGIGKSLICLACGLGLASAQPMLGSWPHPTGTPFKVAVLDLENRPRVIQRRLIRLAMGLKLDLSTIYPASLDIFPLRGVGLFGRDNSPEILSSLTEFQPNLIILDTVMSSTNQDNLSPLAGVRFVRDHVMRWAEHLHCGWWLIHHTKKPDDKGAGTKDSRIGDLHQASGGGFVGMADALVLVQRDDRNRIILTNPKQRHQSNEGRFYLHLNDGGGPDQPLALSLASSHVPAGHAGDLLVRVLPKLPMESPELASWMAQEFNISPRQARTYILIWVREGCVIRTPLTASTGGRPKSLIEIPKNTTSKSRRKS
jgi:hypothetical protein